MTRVFIKPTKGSTVDLSDGTRLSPDGKEVDWTPEIAMRENGKEITVEPVKSAEKSKEGGKS